MAQYNQVYEKATYYDIVFRRDVTRELAFIIELFHRSTGRRPTSLLDLACGPGYHARAFASQGGTAYGLDLREEMIAFANAEAQAEGVQVHWLTQDMRTFVLATPVDIIINMFDGLDCLNTNSDLLAHFRAVAHNLTPGGLYLIDLTHPSEVSYGHYGSFSYSGERDGIAVEIIWAVNRPMVDARTGIATTQIEMHVTQHGQQFVVQDCAQERILTAPEIDLLAQLAGELSVLDFYGDFDLAQPLDNTPASRRMIGVLRKFG